MRRYFWLWLPLALICLSACGTQEAAKRYPMQGEVKAIDASARTATIAAGKIEGWMDAMTMEYPVKPEAELAKIHVGDHVEATVVVESERYYVTDIRVKTSPAPGAR